MFWEPLNRDYKITVNLLKTFKLNQLIIFMETLLAFP